MCVKEISEPVIFIAAAPVAQKYDKWFYLLRKSGWPENRKDRHKKACLFTDSAPRGANIFSAKHKFCSQPASCFSAAFQQFLLKLLQLTGCRTVRIFLQI